MLRLEIYFSKMNLKKRNIDALRWINIDCGSGDLTIDFDNTIL